MSSPEIVLASASPRRAEILNLLGIPFRVRPAHVEEVPRPAEAPADYVKRLACDKARAVMQMEPDAFVLAGDTIVILDDRVLEKPGGPEEAERMLLELSGKPHFVLTGLALGTPAGTLQSVVDRTCARPRTLEAEDVRAYVATGEPLDKAGAYGIQGRGAALVDRVEGDFYAVMGLSVSGLVRLLADAGVPYRFAPDGNPA